MRTAVSIMETAEIGVLSTTVWEISRKASFGKLPRFWGPDRTLATLLAEQSFYPYPLTWEDAEAANDLPDVHRDPFD